MTPSFDDAKGIPAPTLRRFPAYLNQLKRLADEGRDVVSSTHLAGLLLLDPVQVRKDLECTGLVGKPKVGHSVPKLIEAIEHILGWNKVNEAFLVGAGNLGTALLGYPRFKSTGLDLVAAFDTDPAKVDREIHGRSVLPLGKLPDLARRMGIKVGVIAVPAEHAQAVADLMVSAGILAIWNFAPTRLRVPDTVIVQDEDLYSGLATLTQKLAARLRKQASNGALDADD
jgi:redox-sensing transcriptional repressor